MSKWLSLLLPVLWAGVFGAYSLNSELPLFARAMLVATAALSGFNAGMEATDATRRLGKWSRT